MGCITERTSTPFNFINAQRLLGVNISEINDDLGFCTLNTPTPTDFIFTAATTSTLDATCVSSETSFQWEIATDIGFSNIVQTINNSSTSVQFTGLDGSTLYYGHVKALGTIPSAYSNTESTFTLSIYDSAHFVYGLFRATTNNSLNKCATIRRSSDDAETDILFNDTPDFSFITLSNSVSAGGTLGDWVGANDAFVVSWHNQTADNTEVIQNTNSSQQRIILGGVIHLDNATPAIDFTTSGFGLGDTNSYFDHYRANDTFSIFSVASSAGINTVGITVKIVSTLDSGKNNRFRTVRDSGTAKENCVWNDTSGKTATIDLSAVRQNTDQVLQTNINKGGALTTSGWDNGVAGDQDVASATELGSIISDTAITLGQETGASLNGNLQLVVGYITDKSADRAAIESEIITKFSIP